MITSSFGRATVSVRICSLFESLSLLLAVSATGDAICFGVPSVGDAAVEAVFTALGTDVAITDFRDGFSFSCDLPMLDLRDLGKGNGGLVIPLRLFSDIVLFDFSVVTPVTAMLTGRGRRGAAIGRVLMFTELVMLLVLCWLRLLLGLEGAKKI